MFGDLDWPLNASRGFIGISWASCYLRDALHSAAIAVVACLSHAGIASKRITIQFIKLFLGYVASPLRFSNTTFGCDIITGRGACHYSGLGYFRSETLNNGNARTTCRYFSLLSYDKPLLLSLLSISTSKPHYTSSREYFNYLRQCGCGSDGSLWKTYSN